MRPTASVYVLGECAISDGQRTQDKILGQGSVHNRRGLSAEPHGDASASKGKEKKTAGAKRRKMAQRAFSQGDEREALDTDTILKVLGGGQPLVDDYDDADFEARKVRPKKVWQSDGVVKAVDEVNEKLDTFCERWHLSVGSQ